MIKRVRLLVVLSLSIFGWLSLAIGALPVNAQRVSEDPLVITNMDITSHASCIETFDLNIGTSQESITTIPCLAGTIMTTTIVPRSQAIAQHKAYVILPTLKATTLKSALSADPQLQQQIPAVLGNKSLGSKALPFTTQCGKSGTASVLWTVKDDHSVTGAEAFQVYSTESFLKEAAPNCNIVSLDVASMYVDYLSSGCSGSWWDHDQYAGGRFGIPAPWGKWTLYTNGSYSHSVGSDQPAGYTYESWVSSGDCVSSNFGFAWDDIRIN